jgi:hypothetical protein
LRLLPPYFIPPLFLPLIFPSLEQNRSTIS